MTIRLRWLLFALLLMNQAFARQNAGATVSFTTIEAESMRTNAVILSKSLEPHRVETESSGRQAVRLDTKDQFLEFTSPVRANTLVIRFSLPDAPGGGGLTATLDILINGKPAKHSAISSAYTWLYGKYPFSNDPAIGKPRHFYDEIRVKDLKIQPDDIIEIRKGDENVYCIIDLVDLEDAPPALPMPDGALSVTDPAFSAALKGKDYTEVFKQCIACAHETGRVVWIPAGEFLLSGDLILPENTIIRGAGYWHTTLPGDENLYDQPGKRVRLIGKGNNIHLSGFSITGALKYRSDKEPNDGIVGSFGNNSTISDLWIEHTKVGIWVENSSNLQVTGCRMRNTIADGINFCVGMANSTIRNCTARGTGDDGFAIWPAVFGKQLNAPGHNLITHCTAQLPFLANGAAIYGGESNAISNCLFTDITQGSAILISTTFPTENKNKGINNNFSGITTVDSCEIRGSGGFDHEWDWRGAVEICTDKRTISGLQISDITIEGSLSDAIHVVAKNEEGKDGLLQDALLKNIRVAADPRGSGLRISSNAKGVLTMKNSKIPVVNQSVQGFKILE